MSENPSPSFPTPGPSRVEKALSDPMNIEEVSAPMYVVQTVGGDEYRIDVELGACECDDYHYRSEEIGACKHIVRARAHHEAREVRR